MALTAESMRTKIKTHMSAVAAVQGDDPDATQSYRDDMLLAMCRGIIEEITENAVVQTTSGAPDGEHTGIIE